MGNINQALFQIVYGWSHQNYVLDWVGIFLAQYLPYLLVLGFLYLVLKGIGWRRRVYLFAEGALAVILGRGILTEIIRFLYNHARPFDVYAFTPLISESGNSFPSGHMAFFFALALVVYCHDRRWGIWYFVLSAVIGLARIYAGVHWPLDILGGAAVGFLSGWLIHVLLKPHGRGIGVSAPAGVPQA